MAENTSPKVSIIVPVYKVEQYLRRCLDSIAAQTFTDWECILIDDGSPDKSGVICDEYAGRDGRFRVIHQENKGVSAARNAGLDAARGEWIGFVDSDDWVSEKYLERLFFAAKNGDGFSVSKVLFFDAETNEHIANKYIDSGCKNLIGNKKYNHASLRMYFSFPWAKLMPAAACKSVNFDTHFSYGEDALYMFAIEPFLKKGVYAGSDALYFKNDVSESLSTAKRPRRKIAQIHYSLLKAYWKLYFSNIFGFSLSFFIRRNIAIAIHIMRGR